MQWRFTLIDFEGNKFIVDEPTEWDTIGKAIKRDPEWHGIFFQFSLQVLEFSGLAYFLIVDEYNRLGIDGVMHLLIEVQCDECEGFAIFYPCDLDFAQFEKMCGLYCSVKIGLNNSTAETLIRNRQDTNIDLTSLIAYDGETSLADYAAMGKDIIIPSKALLSISSAQNTGGLVSDNLADSGEWHVNVGSPPQMLAQIIPGFTQILYTDINNTVIFNTIEIINGGANRFPASGLTPVLDIQKISENLDCTSENVTIQYRWKGSIAQTGGTNQGGKIQLIKLPAGLDETEPLNYVVLADDGISNAGFDISKSLITTLAEGDRLWLFLFIFINDPDSVTSYVVTSDAESFLKISFSTLCDPTPAQSFLIHESGSRIIENITNNAFKFKSEFYGRTDSEPYSYPQDGCGGLRALTNGLQLRRAKLQDGSNPKVFTNWKDFFQSTNALDAVGIGIEDPDPVLDAPSVIGHVRMEPLSYFYNTDVILYCDGVDKIITKPLPAKIWNKFSCGFDKFETESSNGLDAIHTKREFRTPILNSNAGLEKICKYISDGYAEEVTRRKFGTTQDWRYDQNIFLNCLVREDAWFAVEQGNITNGANLFDPPTVINYRISPIRMVLSWYRWIMQGVKVARKLIFSSGEGNYVAEGELSTFPCRKESKVLAEDQTIDDTCFAFPDDAEPFIVPESVNFKFPLGINEFTSLIPLKYGMIAYRQFEDEDYKYGWIDNIVYSPEQGTAEFNLISAVSSEIIAQAPICVGTAAVITSVLPDGGTGAVIIADAYAGTSNDIYGSITGNIGTYFLLVAGKTSAELATGVTIDPIAGYKYFKIHSYEAVTPCDYGYSSVATFFCTPTPTLTFDDNGDGTITLHVDDVNAGSTILVYGATEETGTYSQIGGPHTAVSGVNDIVVDATVYQWFKVNVFDGLCDYGYSNTVNFIYNPCGTPEAPTITSIVEVNADVVITGTARTGSSIKVFGSTSLNGTYVQIGGAYTAANLVAGITLTPADYLLNTWFKVYSFDGDCVLGFSAPVATLVPDVFFFTISDDPFVIYWTAAKKAKFGDHPTFQAWVTNTDSGVPEQTAMPFVADLPYPNTTIFSMGNAGFEGYVIPK